mmetsp:Transcript_17098/g.42965  ORF Transcript_17098/g.42965 Transcript_17098/m.42965 type:complete len:333 (-) Transcript_17098:111-1109(-)
MFTAQAVFGESPNHSCVNFRQPDSIRFPKHASVASLAVAVTLQAGDALFIPEGWWHQVTSVAGTSAVNFWWQSKASAAIGGANDSFYLRHVMGSMIATEKTRRLDAVTPYPLGQDDDAAQTPTSLMPKTCKRARDNDTATEAHSCEEGARCAHHSSSSGSPPSSSSGGIEESESCSRLDGQLSSREMRAMQLLAFHGTADVDASPDPGTIEHASSNVPSRVFAALSPCEVQRVLIHMASATPRTLEFLLLHSLSPVAVEMMTAKFEAADEVATAPGNTHQVYEQLYSVCTDHRQLMQSLIKKKERFSAECCLAVMSENLNLDDLLSTCSETR